MLRRYEWKAVCRKSVRRLRGTIFNATFAALPRNLKWKGAAIAALNFGCISPLRGLHGTAKGGRDVSPSPVIQITL
jgi:hypothetical protein